MSQRSESLANLLTDKRWRMAHLYQILPEDDADGAIIPFIPRQEQEDFLSNRHHQNFVPKSRKLGISTVIVLDYLDECIFHPKTHCAHVDFREDDAFKKLAMARLAWTEGPKHPDPLISEIWKGIHARVKLVRSNDGTLEWSNGSRQEAGMSFMGGTPRRLHISEFGPLAAQRPLQARAVRRGSFNAVPKSGIKDVETTMEGGRFGECYAIFKLALKSSGRDDLSPLDWRLHFFPWVNHPSYTLPGRKPEREDTIAYFSEMREKHGLVIPIERQAWYEAKSQEQGEDMFTQFPTVIEECDRQVIAGQIYPEMTTLRAKGRVRDFDVDPVLPLYSSWDLGSSDNAAGWLVQESGKDTLFHAWAAGEGQGAPGVASVILQWEREHGEIAMHFLPHDANRTDIGSGKTYISQLIDSGVNPKRITVLPRTSDVWIGINEVRKLLPNAYFHSRTDISLKTELGTELPSGVGRLEGYRRTPNTSSGVIKETPFPDICSHLSDAARYWAEAKMNGYVTHQLNRRFDMQGLTELDTKAKHVEREVQRGYVNLLERGAMFERCEPPESWLAVTQRPQVNRHHIMGYYAVEGVHQWGMVHIHFPTDPNEPVKAWLVAASDHGRQFMDGDTAAARVAATSQYYGMCMCVTVTDNPEGVFHALKHAHQDRIYTRPKNTVSLGGPTQRVIGWKDTDDLGDAYSELSTMVREQRIEVFYEPARVQLHSFMRLPDGTQGAAAGYGAEWVKILAVCLKTKSNAIPFDPREQRAIKGAGEHWLAPQEQKWSSM